MEMLFSFLGGMGVFLFGIKLTGESLKLYAGDRLRVLIDKYTSSPVKGVFVGALATVAMQTSTGTTALTISLVKSGQMKLKQAISVIMGANIGTTFTAFLIGLKISDYALPIVFVGSIMYNFSKNPRHVLLSQALIGFGALFLGLSLMQAPLRPLASSQVFSDLMVSVGNLPILGVLLGIGLTVIVQSSTAMIGIIQTLYASEGITLFAGVALVLGSNVGTTITAIIASAGGSTTTKQTALSHVLFNVFGLIIFYFIFFVFNGLAFVQARFIEYQINPEMQLAIIHGVFSIITAIVLLPFINNFEKLIVRIIKSDEHSTIDFDYEILNPNLVNESPAFALEQVKQAIQITYDMMKQQLKGLQMMDDQSKLEIVSHDTIIAIHKIRYYLSDIMNRELDDIGVQSFHVCNTILTYLEDMTTINTSIANNIQTIENESMKEDLQQIFHSLANLFQTISIINLKVEQEQDVKSSWKELKKRCNSLMIKKIGNKQQFMDTKDALTYINIIQKCIQLGDRMVAIEDWTVHPEQMFDGISEVVDIQSYI